MTAPAYYDFDPADHVMCGYCSHTGPPTCESFAELTQVDCAGCDRRLFLVSYPSVEQTRTAAAAGNPRAIADLRALEQREQRFARAARAALTADSPLPELPGETLVIEWDFVEEGEEHVTVLRHKGLELWRELAFWEGFERYQEVAVLLHQRYGARLRGLVPTSAADVWLLGDRLWTIGAVGTIQARLAAGEAPVEPDPAGADALAADDLSQRRPRLHLSQDAGLDLFSALEFGRVDDGQPSERWEGVGEHVGLLSEEPDGRCVGFVVKAASTYDPDAPQNASLWDGPRFDVPALGLNDVAPNAVFVATRALYGSTPTVNRELFSLAIAADGEAALRRWLRCLQAGDSMAHFALGYTLFELGRIPEAYRHLRHYCDIAPGEAWSWCWLGKAAAALGELGEARAAYQRAIDREDDDEPTDARELLAALDAGAIEVPEHQPATAWQHTLHALVNAVPFGTTCWTDAAAAHVLFDVDPVPVWVNVDGSSGLLQLRVMVGTAPGVSDTYYGELDLLDVIEEDAEDLVTDDDDAWLVLRVTESLTELSPRTLELLVFGAAATAVRLRGAANTPNTHGDELLKAPPAYAEAEQRFQEEP